jgi:hypothetical protein
MREAPAHDVGLETRARDASAGGRVVSPSVYAGSNASGTPEGCDAGVVIEDTLGLPANDRRRFNCINGVPVELRVWL